MSTNAGGAEIAVGDPVDKVKSLLRTKADPAPYPDAQTPLAYKLPKLGVSIFFDRAKKVETVHYEAPFSERVEGVAIGDSKDVVKKKKGPPERKWPIDDGIDRWIYEKKGFLRVDFSPKTQLVEHIWK